MFNRSILLLLICSVSLISACTTTSNFFGHVSTEELIEHHQYQKAIDQINSTSPIDQILLKQVKKLAKQQQKEKTKEINKLIKKKKWGEARDVLNQLNSNQPNLSFSSTLISKINQAQFEEERLINTQRALLEADLLDLQIIQKDLNSRIQTKTNIKSPYSNDLIIKKKNLAEELFQLSTQALFVKDYKNAQTTYEKAIELNRELRTGEIKQAINAGLNHQNTKAINKRRKALIEELSLAISALDFASILKIQEILSHEPFHGIEVDEVIDRAKETRREHAQKLNEIASKQYRNGNISLAVTQWQQALRLDPTDIRIQTRLSRALKVQRKLKKLTSTEDS